MIKAKSDKNGVRVDITGEKPNIWDEFNAIAITLLRERYSDIGLHQSIEDAKEILEKYGGEIEDVK